MSARSDMRGLAGQGTRQRLVVAATLFSLGTHSFGSDELTVPDKITEPHLQQGSQGRLGVPLLFTVKPGWFHVCTMCKAACRGINLRAVTQMAQRSTTWLLLEAQRWTNRQRTCGEQAMITMLAMIASGLLSPRLEVS